MSKLLRYFEPGQYCFITSVTHRRRPLLVEHVDLLCRAVRTAKRKSRFEMIAWVVLPDHFHVIVHCPTGDFPTVVQRVKLSFSLQFQRRVRRRTRPTRSQPEKRCDDHGGIWQHRYWDHIIRSEADLSRHVDYIHRNPVKHSFVDSLRKWKQSSYHEFSRQGYYEPEWGKAGMDWEDDDFGE